MIIDMHRHMWSASERYHELFEDVPGFTDSIKQELDWRITTESIIEEMNEAEVNLSVVIVADFEAKFGPAPFTIEEENLFVVKAFNKHPDRIVPFYGIDPRRPGAAKKFEKAIKDYGIRGLKLHSAVGFSPYDESCYPLYELCVFHRLPVLFHCGLAFHPLLYNRFTHPLQFDQVATDFPKLNMILGHAGHDWWADAIAIAKNHPNVFLEMSEWQPTFTENNEEFMRAIFGMCNALGSDRIVWGSDFPGLRKWMPLKKWIDVFKDLPNIGHKFGYKFSQTDIENILGINASYILELS